MNNSSPLISVIIPTYNYARFLADALNSVLNQNILNTIEIVIIDDGSTDNTVEVVKPFLSRNLKYIYQKNAGLSAARNTGIQASKGQFIQFLDADDILGAHALSGRIKLLQENPDISIVVCRTKLFRNFRKGHPNTLLFERWPIYTRHLDVHLCHFNIAPPHAFLLRRNVLDQMIGFNTDLSACEDYDFWLRALFHGFKFMFSPDGIVYYRQHQESMSQNLQRQRFFDAILHQKLQKLLILNDNFRNRSDVLLAFISGILCTWMRFAKLNLKPPKELMGVYQWTIYEIQQVKHYQDPFLTYFYFLQSLSTLEYCIHNSIYTSRATDLKNQLIDAVPGLKFLEKRLLFFKSTINYLFLYQNTDPLEKLRLIMYTLKIGLNLSEISVK